MQHFFVFSQQMYADLNILLSPNYMQKLIKGCMSQYTKVTFAFEMYWLDAYAFFETEEVRAEKAGR